MFESRSQSQIGLKQSTKQKTTTFSTLANEKSLSDRKWASRVLCWEGEGLCVFLAHPDGMAKSGRMEAALHSYYYKQYELPAQESSGMTCAPLVPCADV
ncbi:unnamed protein product [Caretta caretta]